MRSTPGCAILVPRSGGKKVATTGALVDAANAGHVSDCAQGSPLSKPGHIVAVVPDLANAEGVVPLQSQAGRINYRSSRAPGAGGKAHNSRPTVSGFTVEKWWPKSGSNRHVE